MHGANKPLDPDLKPEKDKCLQKEVFTQPANVKPNQPVAITTGPAPPTPYLCHQLLLSSVGVQYQSKGTALS